MPNMFGSAIFLNRAACQSSRTAIRWVPLGFTDAHWRRIEALIPGKEGDKGRHGEDNRLFVDAVLEMFGLSLHKSLMRDLIASHWAKHGARLNIGRSNRSEYPDE